MTLAIIVGRQFPGANTDSNLHLISDSGSLTKITNRYVTIGKGREIGARIVDEEWREGETITMKDFARTAYYAIRLIEVKGLEPSVGGDPTVVYLGHRAPDDEAASPTDIAEFRSFFETKMQSV